MLASRVMRLCLFAVLLITSLLVSSRMVNQRVHQSQQQSVATVAPEDLTLAFHHAVEALRSHQTAEGYWTTLFTRGPAFEQPVTEVNVFVPALILDLLTPIAQETSLSDV